MSPPVPLPCIHICFSILHANVVLFHEIREGKSLPYPPLVRLHINLTNTGRLVY